VADPSGVVVSFLVVVCILIMTPAISPDRDSSFFLTWFNFFLLTQKTRFPQPFLKVRSFAIPVRTSLFSRFRLHVHFLPVSKPGF